MQLGIFNKKVTGFLMFSLLVSVVSSVAAESYAAHALPRYTPIQLADNSNPWALSQPFMANTVQGSGEQKQNDNVDASKQCSVPQSQQQRPKTIWRFVTPEILDSLKQQQTQMSRMPEYTPNESRTRQYNSSQGDLKRNRSSNIRNRFSPQQYLQPRPGPDYARQNTYAGVNKQPIMGSPYGMNHTNPMFDAPVVSPWGNGADVLYRGESFTGSFPDIDPMSQTGGFPGNASSDFPWLPSEAFGGLPPMHVPSFGKNSFQQNYVNDFKNTGINDDKLERMETNVFNPFTFIQNR